MSNLSPATRVGILLRGSPNTVNILHQEVCRSRQSILQGNRFGAPIETATRRSGSVVFSGVSEAPQTQAHAAVHNTPNNARKRPAKAATDGGNSPKRSKNNEPYLADSFVAPFLLSTPIVKGSFPFRFLDPAKSDKIRLATTAKFCFKSLFKIVDLEHSLARMVLEYFFLCVPAKEDDWISFFSDIREYILLVIASNCFNILCLSYRFSPCGAMYD